MDAKPPGKTMPVALTQSNIQAEFRTTGIYPYNRNLFTDRDFASSFVTNRPNPDNSKEIDDVLVCNSTVENQTAQNVESSSTKLVETITQPISSLIQRPANEVSSSVALIFSPEAVRPLLKAPPRKTNRGMNTRKSTIYTDTPEKEQIMKEHERRLKLSK